MDRLAHLATHALMVIVMGAAMLSQSSLVSMAGAGVLVGASFVCAALSRGRAWLHAHVLDLWAMALVMIAMLVREPAAGSAGAHHAIGVDSVVVFVGVVVAWGLGRLALLARTRRGEWRMPAASAALTLAGLALMPALCG